MTADLYIKVLFFNTNSSRRRFVLKICLTRSCPAWYLRSCERVDSTVMTTSYGSSSGSRPRKRSSSPMLPPRCDMTPSTNQSHLRSVTWYNYPYTIATSSRAMRTANSQTSVPDLLRSLIKWAIKPTNSNCYHS